MFLVRYLKNMVIPTRSEPVVIYRAGDHDAPDIGRVKPDLGVHSVLSEARASTPLRDVFAPPPSLVNIPPVPLKVIEVAREAVDVRRDAAALCKKIISPVAGDVFALNQAFEVMPGDVMQWFLAKRKDLLVKLNDPARRTSMTKSDIAALLIGEVFSLEEAGALAGVQVASSVGKIKNILDTLTSEGAGSKTSVVETEPTYVGETFHILAAAYLRNELGANLKVKTPVSAPNAYSHRFNALIGGARGSDGGTLVERASRTESTDIAKANLTPLMLAGHHKKISELRGLLLSGLTPDTITEIRDRTRHVLESAGMAIDTPKLGIFIRNVKPRANGDGTQDPAGNLTKGRFQDVLNAADKAGIRNIVLLGDAPGPHWLVGTPWEPQEQAPSGPRRKRPAVVAPGGDVRRIANLTEPWISTGNSPLFDGTGAQGPRWHLSTTTAHDTGPEAENSVQGGYAEQLAMYDQLHRELGMVGVVGNRSGVIDGPGFMRVPCIQMVTRAPYPQESPFDRLGLLSMIIPSYKLLNLETGIAANRRGASGAESSHLPVPDKTALQGLIENFITHSPTR